MSSFFLARLSARRARDDALAGAMLSSRAARSAEPGRGHRKRETIRGTALVVPRGVLLGEVAGALGRHLVAWGVWNEVAIDSLRPQIVDARVSRMKRAA